MKKSTLFLWALLLLFANSFAQIQLPPASQKQSTDKPSDYTRCATMTRVEQMMKTNPQLRAFAEQMEHVVPTAPSGNYRTQAIVTIPVVVHIVLPNPNLVTDADVQAQINKLNLDFSGLNPDSTNGANWYSVRGHSDIRFTLARRTPSGALTNGIERITSNTGTNGGNPDPIKHASSGGADVWDPNSYLNYWVGNDASGQGILGYAQFPSSGSAAEDGIFINYQSWGFNSCYVISAYNLGRTAVHETGHYFGLLHIWGDESGCTGDDFRALTTVGSTCVLPANLYNPTGQGNTPSDIGDTPNQGAATTNCPAGVTTDACSAVAPGKMYQNYMDYTFDACYSMFTKQQVARMQYCLDNCRSSLKTSVGATAPTGATTLDASPFQSVNPGGSESVGCGTTTYPSIISCPGAFSPKVRIRNNGLNTINTVTVGYTLNGGAPVTVNVSPNLQFGNTLVVTFPAITITTGTYNFKYFTSSPNGTQPDQVPSNDSLTATLTVSNGTAMPVSENFEALPFPKAGWSLFNPDNNFTWVRVGPGHNSNASMAIDNYNNNNPGQIDQLRTPSLSIVGTDSVIITFDLAHKYYPFAPYDILSVLVSTDCGVTFTSVYSKSGPTLATAGSSTAAYVTPVNSDWRTERIALGGSFLSTGKIIVAFQNTNEYGNNIFIDNINIQQQVTRDIKPETVIAPHPIECGRTITPQVVVRNIGSAPVTSFKVGYILNGSATPVITSFTQTIAAGAAATVTLPVITANIGANTFKVFTADPVGASGTGDQSLSNDTTSFSFTVINTVSTPIVEGFETSVPPPGWTLINTSNSAYTWVKKAPGHNSGFSAYIDEYDNATTGVLEDLKTPAINISNADSVVFSFDVAYKNYPGLSDSLIILASTDCGNTFIPIYSKGGASLATAGSSTAAYNAPAATDWRRDKISLGGSFVSTGSIVFIIRAKSGFGNNIWIDNVNIDKLVGRDLKMVSINQPGGILCPSPTTPNVTVQNVGYLTITGFKVSYTVDNGTPTTSTFTGLNLAPLQSTTVSLTPFTPTAGTHVITIYSTEPVASSGTGDQNTANDTLRKTISVVGSVPAPITEGFEGTTFPPANWAIDNPDGLLTWERTTTASRSGTASAAIRNFDYTAANTIDRLSSPVVTNTSTFDSVFVAFDLAYKPGVNYPGSTDLPLDTLEIQVTKDCGATFTTVWKKWGFDLETVSRDSNNYGGNRFVPGTPDWKNIRLNLTPFVGTSNFQVLFVARSNSQNNLYIDNVNISGKTLPQRLKNQGYLIYPNPFRGSFTIHHFQVPTNLMAAAVYNSVGEKVWDKQYNGQANTETQVNLGKLPAGVYELKLFYTDKTVVERIVKE